MARRKYFVENNQRYGRLLTIEEVRLEKDPNHRYHRCVCDCGNETVVRDDFLCKGVTKSCGCLWNDTLGEYQKNNSKASSLPIGFTSGLLTVIEDLGVIQIGKKRDHCYKCKCTCGKEVIIRQHCLKKRGQQSCGCDRRTNGLKAHREASRKRREYPSYISDFLIYDEEKQGIKEKKYPYETKLHFRCSSCGCILEKPISHIIRLNKNRETPIVLCLDCSNHRSAFEEEVFQYVYSIIPTIEIQTNRWSILRDEHRNYELDIYIPSMKIAIECNGDYFHSETYDKHEKFHMNKFKLAENNGIHLVQLFESSWRNNQTKIKNYLKDLLSKPIVIYARKCRFSVPDNFTVKSFYDENHLQGYSNHCNINYSLVYGNEIIAMMSFCKAGMHNRNKEEGYYELSRYAVKSGYTVIGGPSKLLKHFENIFKPKELLSYSDNDYFSGNMYSQLGFLFDGIPRPRYHWFMRDQSIRTRESCQLKHLSKQYPDLYEKALLVDGNKENFIMNSLGAVKVWHSGNKRWVKYYK